MNGSALAVTSVFTMSNRMSVRWRHASGEPQIALRHGKTNGEQAIVYAEGMDVEAELSRRLEEDLRVSIRSDALALSYQPQLSLKQGRIIGAEALVRWHHRDHGFVSPARFIPLAERTGIISDLSRWALKRACLGCSGVERPACCGKSLPHRCASG